MYYLVVFIFFLCSFSLGKIFVFENSLMISENSLIITFLQMPLYAIAS